MNINWRKVLKVAGKIIRIVHNNLPSTERENIHGKHHSNNHSDRSHHNKKKVKHDIH